MSCWYTVSGRLRLRRCPEVQAIIRQLNDKTHGGDEIVEGEETDNEIVVGLDSFGGHMANSSVSELDELICQFDPYVLEPTLLEYDYDGQDGTLYIGPADQEKRIQSLHTLRTITGLLDDLVPEHKFELRRILGPQEDT